MDAILRLSGTEMARRIAARELSAHDVAGAVLDRIEAVNPTFNAIVSQRPREAVLAEAEAADRALATGERHGPLHGLPIAIKDLANTKGLRTTQGSPIYAETIPDTDALHVARIRAAGALILGKTSTPEFGLGSHTFNPVFGATRNAFDPTRTAGGSSGGAAVALATFMLPIADGSDFGGSLRNPAAWNNIFGFRPSQGRVPSAPVPDAFWSQMATDGPMGRHVEDLALLLSVQAGPDPRAPLARQEAGIDFAEGLADFEPGRIAWFGDLQGHLPFEGGILDLCRIALTSLNGLGCPVEDVAPTFDFERLWRAFVALRHYAVGGKLGDLYADSATRPLLKPEAQWECDRFLALDAKTLYDAAVTRTAWFETATNLFQDFDFLALPSAQVFPFPVEERWPASIAGRPMDSYHRWMEVVVPATMLGCPTVSLPVGFGPGETGHLPMGLQIIGRPGADRAVLRLAYAYERANPWIAAARDDDAGPAISQR